MLKVIKLQVLIITLVFVTGLKSYSQVAGTLYMLRDNFYSQIMNPSFFSSENKIILALPGLAGVSAVSTGNLSLNDLVVPGESGNYTLRFSRLAETGNRVNLAGQAVNLPLFYLGVPITGGAIKIFVNENLQSLIAIPQAPFSWVANDNLEEGYRKFSTGNIGVKSYWNHEVGAGVAQRISDRLIAGANIKLLFNEFFGELRKWNYSLITNSTGDEIIARTRGNAYISAPVDPDYDRFGRVQNLEISKKPLASFFSFNTPGISADLGITWLLPYGNQFSASVKDVGIIWFRKNIIQLSQSKSFVYEGLDFTNSIKPESENYVPSWEVMNDNKKQLKDVFRPSADSLKVTRFTTPKLFLHYQHRLSNKWHLGITNQSLFSTGYLLNIFSASGLYKSGQFDFLGSVSAHGIKSLSLGGGIQWNNPSSRLFIMTDNLTAVYHPAVKKSFALVFGVNFLLKNKERLELWNNPRRRWGKQSTRPFYKELHEDFY